MMVLAVAVEAAMRDQTTDSSVGDTGDDEVTMMVIVFADGRERVLLVMIECLVVQVDRNRTDDRGSRGSVGSFGGFGSDFIGNYLLW